MAITESDLRDLLDGDSGGPGDAASNAAGRRAGAPDGFTRGVTLADVDRRVRRIRRRRLAAAATGVLAAGLAVTGVLTVPRTVTAGGLDDVTTAVMAQPSPSNSRLYSQEDVVLAQQSYHRAGVKRRLTVQVTKRTGRVGVFVTCPNSPSYAIILQNGRWLWDEPCGKFEEGQLKATWVIEEGIDKKRGRNIVEVLLVPFNVPASWPSWQRLSPDERKKVLESAKPYPAEWSVTVREMAPRFS
ncbi:hypothetical protein [Microtetraspora fusca]|uniref:hypothetical protein n=1 Tax=Microtetraspora fusca TaxID=1997 RepID=UPI00082AEE1E|nr:hypothetical protein [Microtetraspora fusca]